MDTTVSEISLADLQEPTAADLAHEYRGAVCYALHRIDEARHLLLRLPVRQPCAADMQRVLNLLVTHRVWVGAWVTPITTLHALMARAKDGGDHYKAAARELDPDPDRQRIVLKGKRDLTLNHARKIAADVAAVLRAGGDNGRVQ